MNIIIVSFKDAINAPKLIFPLGSNKDHLRNILNVNQWDKSNVSLLTKLKLAVKIFFNRYIYYHLKDVIPHKDKIFYRACKFGNMEIVQLMIEKGVKGVYDWNIGLTHACSEGHISIVHLMIKKIESEFSTLPPTEGNDNGANWNDGLQETCEIGHLPIVQLMIEKVESEFSTLPPVLWNEKVPINWDNGLTPTFPLISRDEKVTNWYDGLQAACEGGHISIVQLMIEKIESSLSTLPPMIRHEEMVDYLNNGLQAACGGGYLSIVQLMIEKIESSLSILPPVLRDEKIADYLNDGLIEACNEGHLSIVQLMIEKGAIELASNKKRLIILNYLSELILNISN